jgi:hypothetical protein
VVVVLLVLVAMLLLAVAVEEAVKAAPCSRPTTTKTASMIVYT